LQVASKFKLKNMENLSDYSNYVIAAYFLSSLALSCLMMIFLTKYFIAKSKIKNEKSA